MPTNQPIPETATMVNQAGSLQSWVAPFNAIVKAGPTNSTSNTSFLRFVTAIQPTNDRTVCNPKKT